MADLQWTPAEVGALTIPQLICLTSERPPGREPVRSAEDFAAILARRRADDEEWSK